MGFGRKDAYADAQPCSHLEDYRRRYGMEGYNSLKTSLRPASRATTADLTATPSSPVLPRCHSCSRNLHRLYLCLICSSVSCSNHAAVHAASEIAHVIFVDTERAELFCFACVDQVYDPDFDTTVGPKQIGGVSARLGIRSGAKRKTAQTDNCGPSNRCRLVTDTPDPRAAKNPHFFPFGLRGLNNLGSTCFMNSVLQVLLHTPPLRNYFLNNGHNRDLCTRASARTRFKGSLAESTCLSCEVRSLFTAAFSGDREPYSPARFLYSWWQHAENLATYDQQDAHEFFMSILDGIHEKEKPRLQTKGY